MWFQTKKSVDDFLVKTQHDVHGFNIVSATPEIPSFSRSMPSSYYTISSHERYFIGEACVQFHGHGENNDLLEMIAIENGLEENGFFAEISSFYPNGTPMFWEGISRSEQERYHRQGAGTALLSVIQQDMIKRGVRIMTVYTEAERMKDFLKRNAFMSYMPEQYGDVFFFKTIDDKSSLKGV